MQDDQDKVKKILEKQNPQEQKKEKSEEEKTQEVSVEKIQVNPLAIEEIYREQFLIKLDEISSSLRAIAGILYNKFERGKKKDESVQEKNN